LERKARRLLREDGAGETHRRLAPRRLPGPPAESEAPGAEINSQVNTAIIFEKQKKTGHLVLS
jgi:hypothetical protein